MAHCQRLHREVNIRKFALVIKFKGKEGRKRKGERERKRMKKAKGIVRVFYPPRVTNGRKLLPLSNEESVVILETFVLVKLLLNKCACVFLSW